MTRCAVNFDVGHKSPLAPDERAPKPNVFLIAGRHAYAATAGISRKPHFLQSFGRVLAYDRFIAFGIGELAKLANRRDRMLWSQ